MNLTVSVYHSMNGTSLEIIRETEYRPQELFLCLGVADRLARKAFMQRTLFD